MTAKQKIEQLIVATAEKIGDGMEFMNRYPACAVLVAENNTALFDQIADIVPAVDQNLIDHFAGID